MELFKEPNMIFVKGGTFQMGNKEGDDNEEPVHTVRVQHFYIGKYAVSFREYDFFCETTRRPKPELGNWESERGTRPVYNVSWKEANRYCQWLTEKTGKMYRLPTEAEWEYAARGGRQANGYAYAGSNDVEEVAWYISNCNYQSHQVGQKKANELGLYDMSGNVWEWCNDWYDKNYYVESDNSDNPKGPATGIGRVIRGGAWHNSVSSCGVSSRTGSSSSTRSEGVGFRLAHGI